MALKVGGQPSTLDVIGEKLNQIAHMEVENNIREKSDIVGNVNHSGEMTKLSGVELRNNGLILVENNLMDILVGPLMKENKTHTNAKSGEGL